MSAACGFSLAGRRPCHLGHRPARASRTAAGPARRLTGRESSDASFSRPQPGRAPEPGPAGSAEAALPREEMRQPSTPSSSGRAFYASDAPRRVPRVRVDTASTDPYDARAQAPRLGSEALALSAPRRPPRGSSPSGRDRSGRVVLPRSAVVGKELVTRTSGVKLGTAQHLGINPSTWCVEAVFIGPGGLLNIAGLSSAEEEDMVLLSSLRQIGDVILVHDESAVQPPFDSEGFLRLVGFEVVTERGDFLGRVRDFSFRPDDGAVLELVYDTYGSPLVPDALVSTFRLGADRIVAAGINPQGRRRVIVQADALLHVEQLTVGIVERLGFASSSVEVGDRPVDYSDPDVRDRMRRAAADDPVYAAQLEQWFQSMAEWQATYGSQATRRARGAADLSEVRQRSPARQPMALPEPRSRPVPRRGVDERRREPELVPNGREMAGAPAYRAEAYGAAADRGSEGRGRGVAREAAGEVGRGREQERAWGGVEGRGAGGAGYRRNASTRYSDEEDLAGSAGQGRGGTFSGRSQDAGRRQGASMREEGKTVSVPLYDSSIVGRRLPDGMDVDGKFGDEASGAETRGRKPPRESRNDPQGGRPFPDFLEEAPGQTASWWP